MKEKMIYGLLFVFLVALTGVPAVHAGENFKEVSDQIEENDSDPSAFEGDSGAVSDERAPESLPMSDAPAVDGVGIR